MGLSRLPGRCGGAAAEDRPVRTCEASRGPGGGRRVGGFGDRTVQRRRPEAPCPRARGRSGARACGARLRGVRRGSTSEETRRGGGGGGSAGGGKGAGGGGGGGGGRRRSPRCGIASELRCAATRESPTRSGGGARSSSRSSLPAPMRRGQSGSPNGWLTPSRRRRRSPGCPLRRSTCVRDTSP